MKVLIATAELAPLVKVGGLGDAVSGLVKALGGRGLDVDVVIPDYWGDRHRTREAMSLETPDWAEAAEAHPVEFPGPGRVFLLSTPSLPRPDPYNDAEGLGWPDNDRRFFSFSAAAASFIRSTNPDVVHLNDWHTGAVLGLLEEAPPTVFTMHNPAYQGVTDESWRDVMLRRSDAYEWYGGTNPLAGAVRLADRVTTVSPGFAAELEVEETGFGLSELLSDRGEHFVGIINGIDTEIWDPETDQHLPITYGMASVARKRKVAAELRDEVGLTGGNGPLLGMVTRLTGQKGVDLALEAVARIPDPDISFVLLGSGDPSLAESARALSGARDGRFAFVESFDEGLAHRIFAGSDLVLVPSRFEPCGLTQMQAMRYGAFPVVTPVGGLGDTVIDADTDPEAGNGFVAADVSSDALLDALGRGIRAWRSTRRRGQIRRLGMLQDWSWRRSAAKYEEIYRTIRRAR